MKNKISTNIRSDEEILSEIDRLKDDDFFGFKRCDLISYLNYEQAKQFLKPEITQEKWTAEPRDRESILKQMEDYMPFAWEKANDERGISAGRSLAHFTAWIWMIGDENHFVDLEIYRYYGKDNLRKICDFYGWDADKWDDGRRVN